jgi:hypothetical protein
MKQISAHAKLKLLPVAVFVAEINPEQMQRTFYVG